MFSDGFKVFLAVGSSGGDSFMTASSVMHMLKIYNGEIPYSSASNWISDDAHFKNLVVKAYR